MRHLYLFSALFIGFLLIFSTPILADTIEQERKTEAVNDHWNVSLNKTKRYNVPNDFNKEFIFDIVNKKSDRHSRFIMKNMTTEVNSLMIVNKKLIVLGQVKSNVGHGITIIDMSKVKEVDFILCYNPKFSTNKRYIIYEKFYPRFSPKRSPK